MEHESAYLLIKGRPEKPANPLSDILPWDYTGNKLHPTQKPISALTPIIETYSQKGDVVLDPFGGSGSTAIAARQCDRHFVLFEKDENYFEAAKARLLTEKLGEH
jgi:site-specific DNA-methyltransferase (adenine-specific)